MRTKTLLLAAAVSAAGIATIQAQSNVYSLNVVGYYNIVIPGQPGSVPQGDASRFKLATLQLKPNGIANPTLNNTLTNVSPAGGGLVCHTWTVPTGWDVPNEYDVDVFGGWENPAGDKAIPLGAGFFLKNTTTHAITVTVVGEVPQGALVNAWTVSGNNLNPRGSQVPQAGAITDVLGFTNVGNAVYRFNNPLPSWNGPKELFGINPTDWEDGVQYSFDVGESAMVVAPPGTPRQWNRNFTVQ